uniref:Uncharacterized protein n=1 Tax=Romanomermis culicivorax TaxID=13658 RepID=A0A915JMQ4_ROMCU
MMGDSRMWTYIQQKRGLPYLYIKEQGDNFTSLYGAIWRGTVMYGTGHYIEFPTENEFEKLQRSFYEKRGFTGVIIVIDCTHIHIHGPGGDDLELYGATFRSMFN